MQRRALLLSLLILGLRSDLRSLRKVQLRDLRARAQSPCVSSIAFATYRQKGCNTARTCVEFRLRRYQLHVSYHRKLPPYRYAVGISLYTHLLLLGVLLPPQILCLLLLLLSLQCLQLLLRLLLRLQLLLLL